MEKMEKIDNNMPKIRIPEEEFTIKYTRASGPGGQNVNKVATRVQLFWNMEASNVITDEQKEKIRQTYPNRISEKGIFRVECQETRFREQNRVIAIARLHELVNKALIPEKERVPTKVPKRVKEKRLRKKKIRSEKKKLRKEPLIDF